MAKRTIRELIEAGQFVDHEIQELSMRYILGVAATTLATLQVSEQEIHILVEMAIRSVNGPKVDVAAPNPNSRIIKP